jgi:hypothetical protein
MVLRYYFLVDRRIEFFSRSHVNLKFSIQLYCSIIAFILSNLGKMLISMLFTTDFG